MKSPVTKLAKNWCQRHKYPEIIWKMNRFIYGHFTKEKTDMVSKHKQRFNMMSQIKMIQARQRQLWEGIEIYCMLVSAQNADRCRHFRSH